MKWVVIMAGGSGTRFWPVSRSSRPKQLISFVGKDSLIKQTYQRSKLLCPPRRILIVTTENLKKKIGRELKGLPSENIICEPVGRDTAACIGLAAVIVHARDSKGLMAVLPADHVIRNRDSFVSTMNACFQAADREMLVTLGIKPAFPSTAYGYVQQGTFLKTYSMRKFYEVKKFHEKPGKSKAAGFVRKKEFFWNSGIFVWKAEVFLENLKKHLKGTYSALYPLQQAVAFPRKMKAALKKIYPKLPRISVDYAIMEKAQNVVMTPARDFGWDDMGSWSSLERHYLKDKERNILLGDAIAVNSRDCIIVNNMGQSKMIAAAVGVEDLIIVQTGDAVLVCRKSCDQDIKKVLQLINAGKTYRKRYR